MHSKFPSDQQQNLTVEFVTDLLKAMEDDSLVYDKAFIKVSLQALDYDMNEGILSDGSSDFGFDYGLIGQSSAKIFQFKCQDFIQQFDPEMLLPSKEMTDLKRIEQAIFDIDRIPETANTNTKKILTDLFDAIKEFETSEPDSDTGKRTYQINIHLVSMMKDFTDQAKEEFEKITSNRFSTYGGVEILLKFQVYFIKDLLNSRWRQQNTYWKNRYGTSQEKIRLYIVDHNNGYLSSTKWYVFFTRCIDLVNAYKDLGYQIFEPNVRCKISKSPINEDIKKSLSTERGIKEFKHLNNGITIVCDAFTKPKGKDEFYVELTHPGIINGLQTITSIAEAYAKDLDEYLKREFEKNCHVLVRVHQKGSVKDVNNLVRSTNNQNTMQPRNFKSNSPEQRVYQSSFAKMNWFYARKEREWDAFKSDPKAWPLLDGKRHKNFKSLSKFKIIDNGDLAKTYLSFIGFTLESLNNTKKIFSDEGLYDIIYKKRIARHGIEYSMEFNKNRAIISDEAMKQSQYPEVLLLSYLCQEVAKSIAPNMKKVREEVLQKIKPRDTAEETNAALRGNQDYARASILRGTALVFTEFVGFILYSSFSSDLRASAVKFLNNGSMKKGYEDYDFSDAIQSIADQSYEDDDLILVLWSLYEDIIDGFVSDPAWIDAWKAQGNVSRYHHGHSFRRKVLDAVVQRNQTLQRRSLDKPFSKGFDDNQSIFVYVSKLLG